ncbi:four helix bundle protein [Flavobacterium aquaticum]|uniref:Four helix bundle protein n=1 Tax=Flavobacterium aquaticum TaxID=1236486 RepID=A0A327YLI6_9FLAO|nr:four helix bundle protein [Flavobacterium aquaticum]RAK20615.1 four helix bundle protein [Flavobacterium aquaticum]
MENNLVARTRKFAIDCMILCSKLPKTREYNAYVNQLIRCSASVGANYRASQRAKSTPDFINKLKIVEEVDESNYFLDLLQEVSKIQNEDITIFEPLLKESKELLAITIASIKTKKANS